MRRFVILFICVFAILPIAFARANDEGVESPGKEEKFDQLALLMHHIADSHSWKLFGYTDSKGQEQGVSIPLPIILYSDGGLHIFSSSKLGEEGTNVVSDNGSYFKLVHNKIYLTDAEGKINLGVDAHVENQRPLDLSVTRNVASMWISMIIIFAVFISIARRYRKPIQAPRGIQSFFEPIILFVRDDIVYTQIGRKHSERYLPFLMTLFFFIWINNLLGLVPFFPGGSNLSGNISFAMVLAVATFIITNFNGSKTYWKHIFTAPGIPGIVKVILVPVEFLGIFTKPFALMIRLFANITAGHLLILSLVSMIFVFKSIFVAPPSVLIVVAMSVLELFVGVLQAYIFTLLTALFIGMAIHEEEHH